MGKSSKSERPGHYTPSGTRKYQANGPVEWGKVFQRVAGKDGREGEGIRAALAYAVERGDAFVAWAEGHIGAWAPASSAPATKGVRASAAAAAAKAKAPKAPKAPPKAKAPKAKAPRAVQAAPAPAEGK